MAEVLRRQPLYRETAAAAGYTKEEVADLERRSWLMRVVHVAPDRETALRATEAPFMGYQQKMSRLRSDSTGGTVPNSFDRSLLRLRSFADYMGEGWLVIGSPEEVRDRLQADLAGTGLQRLMLLTALPGLDTEMALRSMRLFVEKVAHAL